MSKTSLLTESFVIPDFSCFPPMAFLTLHYVGNSMNLSQSSHMCRTSYHFVSIRLSNLIGKCPSIDLAIFSAQSNNM